MAGTSESPVVGKERIQYDPETFTELWFYYHFNGDITIHERQDITAFLERNKALYAATDERAPWKGEGIGVQAAAIPNVLINKWVADGVIEKPADIHDKKIRKLLNSSEYQYLRTRPGDI